MRWTVSAPARLHFGLLQIDPRQPRCYGGLGLMLQHTAVQLTATSAAEFSVISPTTELIRRITSVVDKTCDTLGLSKRPPLAISVDRVAALHSGLGVGTQLACATATAVAASTELIRSASLFRANDSLSAAALWQRLAGIVNGVPGSDMHCALAAAAGRGKRSHIGVAGFLHGGFIRDRGSSISDDDGPRTEVIDWPDHWRIVLLRPRTAVGLHGDQEQRSFDGCSGRNTDVPRQMSDLTTCEILPTLRSRDFVPFGESLSVYNRLAGRLFDMPPPDYTTTLREMDRGREVLANAGLPYYGQSSWGPTLWALRCIDSGFTDTSLTDIAAVLRTEGTGDGYEAVEVAANSVGAMIRIS